jgi:hypothetical protein
MLISVFQDVMYLSRQNHELMSQLQQAIQWDPAGLFSSSSKSARGPSTHSTSVSPSPGYVNGHTAAFSVPSTPTTGVSPNTVSNGLSSPFATASTSPSTPAVAPIRLKKWSSFLPSVIESPGPTPAELETFDVTSSKNSLSSEDPNNPFGMKARPLVQKKAAPGSDAGTAVGGNSGSRVVTFAPSTL